MIRIFNKSVNQSQKLCIRCFIYILFTTMYAMCICVYLCVGAYIYIYIYVYVYVYVYVCVCVCVCVYVFIYRCVCVCMCVSVCFFFCIYVYVCVYVSVCVYLRRTLYVHNIFRIGHVVPPNMRISTKKKLISSSWYHYSWYGKALFVICLLFKMMRIMHTLNRSYNLFIYNVEIHKIFKSSE